MTEATIFGRLIRVGDRRAGHTTIYVVDVCPDLIDLDA